MKEFAELLNRAVPRFTSKKAMAKAIGLSPTRLSHALKGGEYPFNVENCLRLADVADIPPREVLRAAGKAEIADLLDRLYPRAGKPSLTATEWKLVVLFRETGRHQPALLEVVSGLSAGRVSKGGDQAARPTEKETVRSPRG
jgi:hypothetical protein